MATTNAQILAAITDLTALVSGIESRVTALETVSAAPVAPKAPAKTRKAKPAKPVTPEFIVSRAQNRDTNRALAAALRAKGVEPNGAAWDAAKAMVAGGVTVKRAAYRVSVAELSA